MDDPLAKVRLYRIVQGQAGVLEHYSIRVHITAIRIQNEDGQRYGIGDLAKFFFVLAKLNLSLLQVFNIRSGSIPLDNLSALIAQRDGAMQEPAILPVRSSPEASFIFKRLSSSQRCMPFFRVDSDVRRVKHRLPASP